MRSAAVFWCALIGAALWGAEPAPRAAPTRPGSGVALPAAAGKSLAPLPTRKFDRVDYVSVVDVAKRLELQAAWLTRGRRLALTATGVRAELENDAREAEINGLRVFLGDPIRDADGQLFVSWIDYERCLTPLLRPGWGVAPPSAPKIIVLDPGHGGRDNGTSVNEKVFALDVAQRTKKLLLASGFKVGLTRDDDTFVDLVQRAAATNLAGADLFVSIHFNALENDRRTSGVEIYTFPPARQHAAVWWSTAQKDDPHLETSDEPVNRFDHWNVVLAQSLHRRLVKDLGAFDRGKKLMHLGVLRGLKCPGVLVECGFLTSDIDARRINTPEYRQKIAEAIAAGVREYADVLRH